MRLLRRRAAEGQEGAAAPHRRARNEEPRRIQEADHWTQAAEEGNGREIELPSDLKPKIEGRLPRGFAIRHQKGLWGSLISSDARANQG